MLRKADAPADEGQLYIGEFWRARAQVLDQLIGESQLEFVTDSLEFSEEATGETTRVFFAILYPENRYAINAGLTLLENIGAEPRSLVYNAQPYGVEATFKGLDISMMKDDWRDDRLRLTVTLQHLPAGQMSHCQTLETIANVRRDFAAGQVTYCAETAFEGESRVELRLVGIPEDELAFEVLRARGFRLEASDMPPSWSVPPHWARGRWPGLDDEVQWTGEGVMNFSLHRPRADRQPSDGNEW